MMYSVLCRSSCGNNHSEGRSVFVWCNRRSSFLEGKHRRIQVGSCSRTRSRTFPKSSDARAVALTGNGQMLAWGCCVALLPSEVEVICFFTTGKVTQVDTAGELPGRG